MMTEFVVSKGYKKMAGKFYCWGIMLGIVGGLLLLNQISAGKIVVTIGGIMHALVYCFNAFLPLQEELDWTLVYPELAMMPKNGDIDELKAENKKSIQKTDSLTGKQ